MRFAFDERPIRAIQIQDHFPIRSDHMHVLGAMIRRVDDDAV